MEIHIFAIKDRGINAYMRPFFGQHPNQAIRMFQDECNRPDGEVIKHPDDYDLYHLGTFNEETGQIKMLEQGPHQLALGKNMVREPQNPHRP